MNDAFLDLIEGLSRFMEMKLKPEDDKMLTLLIEKKLALQIEYDPEKDLVQILSPIADLPPGKYRENILLHALIDNVYPYSIEGTLAFSAKLGKLVLFHTFFFYNLTPEKLHEFLPRFIKRAKEWQESLTHSNAAPASVMQRVKKQDSQNPFGIRP